MGVASDPVANCAMGFASDPMANAAMGVASDPAVNCAMEFASDPAANAATGVASDPAVNCAMEFASDPAANAATGVASDPAVNCATGFAFGCPAGMATRSATGSTTSRAATLRPVLTAGCAADFVTRRAADFVTRFAVDFATGFARDAFRFGECDTAFLRLFISGADLWQMVLVHVRYRREGLVLEFALRKIDAILHLAANARGARNGHRARPRAKSVVFALSADGRKVARGAFRGHQARPRAKSVVFARYAARGGSARDFLADARVCGVCSRCTSSAS
jgi:hypothetical protein